MESTKMFLICFVVFTLYPCTNTQRSDKLDVQSLLQILKQHPGDLKWNLFSSNQEGQNGKSSVNDTGLNTGLSLTEYNLNRNPLRRTHQATPNVDDETLLNISDQKQNGIKNDSVSNREALIYENERLVDKRKPRKRNLSVGQNVDGLTTAANLEANENYNHQAGNDSPITSIVLKPGVIGLQNSKRPASNRATQLPDGLLMSLPRRKAVYHPETGIHFTNNMKADSSGHEQITIEGQVDIPKVFPPTTSSAVSDIEHFVRKSPYEEPAIKRRYRGGYIINPEYTAFQTLNGKLPILMPLDGSGARRKKKLSTHSWKPYFTAPGLSKNNKNYESYDNLKRKKNALIKHDFKSGIGITNRKIGNGNVLIDGLNKFSENRPNPQTIDIFVAPGLNEEAPLTHGQCDPKKQHESVLLREGSFRPIHHRANKMIRSFNSKRTPRIKTTLPISNEHLQDRSSGMTNTAHTQMDASGSGDIAVEGEITIPDRLLDLSSQSHTFQDKGIIMNRGINGTKIGIPGIAHRQEGKASEGGQLPVTSHIPSTILKVSENLDAAPNVKYNSLKYNQKEGRRFKDIKVCK